MWSANPENDDYDEESEDVEDHQAVLDLGPKLGTPYIDNKEDYNHGEHEKRPLVWLWVVSVWIVDCEESLDDGSCEEGSRSIAGLP